MEESLGAGFDRIRGIIMPPSNFESSLIFSPAITQTLNDIEGPTYLRLTSTDDLDSSGRMILNEGEGSRLSSSNGSEDIDLEWPHRSTDFDLAERMPGLASLIQQINNPSITEVDSENDRLVENCDSLHSDCLSPVIDSENDSDDPPEDMGKFYNGLYTRTGNTDNGYYDDDDMSLEDFEDDANFEEFRLGSGLAHLVVEPEENNIDPHFSGPPSKWKRPFY